jgi:hypothetical protein
MAIKELEQYKALEQRAKNLFGDNTDLFSVVEELKELKKQTKTDWIPCEERLPSESKEYLVTHKEIIDGKTRYRTNYDTFNAVTRKWNKVEARYYELEVVAWQEDILPYEEMKEREEKCEFEKAFPRSNDYICKKNALICTAEKLKYCKYKQPYKKEGAEND